MTATDLSTIMRMAQAMSTYVHLEETKVTHVDGIAVPVLNVNDPVTGSEIMVGARLEKRGRKLTLFAVYPVNDHMSDTKCVVKADRSSVTITITTPCLLRRLLDPSSLYVRCTRSGSTYNTETGAYGVFTSGSSPVFVPNGTIERT